MHTRQSTLSHMYKRKGSVTQPLRSYQPLTGFAFVFRESRARKHKIVSAQTDWLTSAGKVSESSLRNKKTDPSDYPHLCSFSNPVLPRADETDVYVHQ